MRKILCLQYVDKRCEWNIQLCITKLDNMFIFGHNVNVYLLLEEVIIKICLPACLSTSLEKA